MAEQLGASFVDKGQVAKHKGGRLFPNGLHYYYLNSDHVGWDFAPKFIERLLPHESGHDFYRSPISDRRIKIRR